MADDAAPPPEAVLIKRARQAKGISPEDAATRTSVIKSRRWRQIESGQDRGRPVRGDDDVIAHMASVVGLTPEQLAGAGRGEAAEVLREIVRQAERRRQASVMPGVAPGELPQVRAFLEGLRRRDDTRPGDDDELVPECYVEQEILSAGGDPQLKREIILDHRSRGHSDRCGPFAPSDVLDPPALRATAV